MTRFRNVKLGVFRQYQNTKTILKKKNMGQNCFKKLSKFQKFQLSNFTLTWSKEGEMNDIMIKELKQKMKRLDKLIFKTFDLNNFNEILWHGYIYEQQSFSDGY